MFLSLSEVTANWQRAILNCQRRGKDQTFDPNHSGNRGGRREGSHLGDGGSGRLEGRRNPRFLGLVGGRHGGEGGDEGPARRRWRRPPRGDPNRIGGGEEERFEGEVRRGEEIGGEETGG